MYKENSSKISATFMIDNGVLNDEFTGVQGFCPVCRGSLTELTVSERTTEETIISIVGLSRTLPSKRKFIDI